MDRGRSNGRLLLLSYTVSNNRFSSLYCFVVRWKFFRIFAHVFMHQTDVAVERSQRLWSFVHIGMLFAWERHRSMEFLWTHSWFLTILWPIVDTAVQLNEKDTLYPLNLNPSIYSCTVQYLIIKIVWIITDKILLIKKNEKKYMNIFIQPIQQVLENAVRMNYYRFFQNVLNIY